MTLLRFITPEETQRRRRNRLRRRTFHIRGPNELWSIDGYDKLKHFGFAIHGCIDAYSRRILWLKASSTNNDPKVIAWYYLKCVQKTKGTPKSVCCDCGTENSSIAFLQPFLRDVATSFRYGKSVSNQRIEAFWSILRRWSTDWWINFFHGMQYEGLYEECNFIHSFSDSLRFCFMHIIQKELDDVVTLWNSHQIRPTNNTIGGIPNVLYELPLLNGTRDYKCDVASDSLRYAFHYAYPPPPPVSFEYLRAAYMIMTENNITSMPSDTFEALDLYFLLTTTFDRYIV